MAVQARAQVVRRDAASTRSRYVRFARRGAVEGRARRRTRDVQGASIRTALPRARAGHPRKPPKARSKRAFHPAIAMAAANWSTPIARGLDSATDYRVRERLKNAALLELRLHTGRQHQIRLHLEKIGHPLIGERVYSEEPRATGRMAPVPSAERNMLHAWTLAFPHPLTGEPIAVEAPLPADFVRMMKKLALLLLLSLVALPALAQTTISSPDGRKQMQAVQATSPIVVDGALDEEVWSARGAGHRLHRSPIRSRVSRRPRSPKSASPTTRTISTSPRFCRDSDPSGIVVNEHPQGLRRPRPGHLRRAARHVRAIAATASCSRPTPTAPRPIRRWPTKAATSTPTGTRCGGSNRGAPPTAGPPSSASRSRRCASRPAMRKTWGINFARRVRRKSEVSYWSPVSRAYTIYRASAEGNLNGLSGAQAGPQHAHQAISRRRAPCAGSAKTDSIGDLAAGVDFKAGITPSLTFDATINPDFAQAEADEQQVNLTQFSLFFPEKREFFLENAGIFYIGDIPRNKRVVEPLQPSGRGRAAVLQPPHRPHRQRRAAAALRRRAPHRARRRLRARLHDHAERGGGRASGQQLHRGARSPRHLQELGHRRDLPVAPAGRQQRRLQSRRRRRCQLPILQEPQHQLVRGAIRLTGRHARTRMPARSRSAGKTA